jgi:hypothetical protein
LIRGFKNVAQEIKHYASSSETGFK